jgi:hypothetical protein
VPISQPTIGSISTSSCLYRGTSVGEVFNAFAEEPRIHHVVTGTGLDPA